MLIRFTIENFLSFKERQSFSLLPGKGRLKPEHKTSPVNGIATLKTSLIFGANASGKSNLIKGIAFGKNQLLKLSSDKLIDFQNFRLDKDFADKDSRIEYEIQHKGKNYAYGFVFNTHKIVEEWLYEINKSSEKKIFERSNIADKVDFDLSELFKKNKKDEDKQFLSFIAKGTPDNKLFLSEIRNRKVKENVSDIADLLNVIDWFENSLKVIFPDDKYKQGLQFELKEDEKLNEIFESFLNYFDTGINKVSLQEVDIDKVDFPSKLLSMIKNDILGSDNIGEMKGVIIPTKKSTFFISANEDKSDIICQKFMTGHNLTENGKIEWFDTSDESDGTNRIIDFIPLLVDLLDGDNVFIIDEMERSLHPNLIYDLLDLFLSKSKDINSQLILASHESSLLTQKLLRKDEVWFVVKNKQGESKLHSLEEYNVRFDKEIRKDYLLGRFKAIPKLGSRDRLAAIQN